MDPNQPTNPNDPWAGQPAAPQQPGVPQQPGTPVNWSAAGAPPTPNLYYTPAPQVQPSIAKRLLGGVASRLIVVGIVIAIGAGIAAFKYMTSNDGKVMFTLSAPTSTRCDLPETVTTVTSTQEFYVTALMRNHQDGSKPLTVTVTYPDGETESDTVLEADGGAFDCSGWKESVGPLDPGVYKFQFYSGIVLEAEGSITVK
jgi:hypothetical protein